MTNDYGLIIDTKAYSSGFTCGAHDRDEMLKYLREAIAQPANHPSHWWQTLPEGLRIPEDVRFLFVSSRFTGDYAKQFQRLSQVADNMRGAGITAAQLLLFAESLMAGTLQMADGSRLFGSLDQVIIAFGSSNVA